MKSKSLTQVKVFNKRELEEAEALKEQDWREVINEDAGLKDMVLGVIDHTDYEDFDLWGGYK